MNIADTILNWLGDLTGGSDVFNVIFSILFLIIGFFMLIKGADWFVDGASKVAEKMKIPMIVIGLTIVAFGTSAPEAAISITSACQNNAGIAIGNVLGSNIMNILLILGISALFCNLAVKKNTFRFEIPFVAFITAVLLLISVLGMNLDIFDSLILIALFVIFFIYLIRISKDKDSVSDDEVPSLTAKDTIPKMIAMILIGLVFIVLGSDFTVSGASAIAVKLGVTPRIIGLTIVAFGTSLPELVTSVTAARKGKTDIAVGNIIGSNIFNILFVLGLSALVSPNPIAFESSFIIDAVVAIAVALLLWLLVLRKKQLTKLGGIIMLACYAGYFVYLILSPAAAAA